MSSSSDGTDDSAGDWGNRSASCVVGTFSAIVDAEVAAVLTASGAPAAGTSVCKAAVVDGDAPEAAVVAASGTVDGSTVASVGVDFQGVQDRLRVDMMRTDGAARRVVLMRGLLPSATCDSLHVSKSDS